MRDSVVSDTHGNYSLLHQVVKALARLIPLIHAGDGGSDLANWPGFSHPVPWRRWPATVIISHPGPGNCCWNWVDRKSL